MAKCFTVVKLRDCKDIQDTGNHHGDGMYRLDLSQQGTSVKCDMTTDGGGWTVIAFESLLGLFCLFSQILRILSNKLHLSPNRLPKYP